MRIHHETDKVDVFQYVFGLKFLSSANGQRFSTMAFAPDEQALYQPTWKPK